MDEKAKGRKFSIAGGQGGRRGSILIPDKVYRVSGQSLNSILVISLIGQLSYKPYSETHHSLDGGPVNGKFCTVFCSH